MVSLYGRAIGDLQKDFIDGKSKILTCEKSSYLEVTRGTRPHTPVLPSRSFPLRRPVPLCTFLSFCCCFCCLAARLCPTLCDPLDCNLPGSSVHGLAQARILEWDLPAPRFELASPALQADSLSLSHLGSPCLAF